VGRAWVAAWAVVVGVVARLTYLLLVLEEVAAEREAGAQQLSDIPLRGDA